LAAKGCNLIAISLSLKKGLKQVLLCVVSSLSIKKARQTDKPRIQRPINGLRMPLKATV